MGPVFMDVRLATEAIIVTEVSLNQIYWYVSLREQYIGIFHNIRVSFASSFVANSIINSLLILDNEQK